MKIKPLLTIILPNYNHSIFLEKTINDLIIQSYNPKEIIVVDDGSTDNSVEIIKKIANKNKIIKLLVNEKNLGIFNATNKALKIASGEYFYFAGADDIIYPKLFEKSILLLNRFEKAGLCSSAGESIENNGTRIQFASKNISKFERYINPDECNVLLQSEGVWMGGCTTIYRRNAFLQAGGFNSDLGPYCDLFLQMTIALKQGVCFIPECLGAQRIYESSYSAKEKHNIDYYINIYDKVEQLMINKHKNLYSNKFIESWKLKEYNLFYLSYLYRMREKELSLTEILVNKNNKIDSIFIFIMRIFSYVNFITLSLYIFVRREKEIRYILKKSLNIKVQRIKYKLICKLNR